jgi:hypothetical protein
VNPTSCQLDLVAPKKWDLKTRTIVKFPYLFYEPIIRGLLPIFFCCIEADTTVLVAALFILAYRVKCIPIYLVPLESTYSRRWCTGQQEQLISNSGVIREKSFSQPPKHDICSRIIHSSDCPGCSRRIIFLCCVIYGATKIELCKTV